MLKATCKCGSYVPFVVEEERKGPIYQTCGECGRRYKLTVSQVPRSKWDGVE